MSQNSDFLKAFQDAVQNKDSDKQAEMIKAVLDKGIQSVEVGQLATLITLLRVPYLGFLEGFVNANPNIFHICRVFIADIYANDDKLELASEGARTFLKMHSQISASADLTAIPDLMTSVAHAHLLLTAMYTEVGARSYSERILDRALALELSPAFRSHIESELERLTTELQSPEASELNRKWEDFFVDGLHFEELYALVVAKGYTLLAKRLELLDSNFRFQVDFQVGEQEILQEVFTVQHKGDSSVSHVLQ